VLLKGLLSGLKFDEGGNVAEEDEGGNIAYKSVAVKCSCKMND